MKGLAMKFPVTSRMHIIYAVTGILILTLLSACAATPADISTAAPVVNTATPEPVNEAASPMPVANTDAPAPAPAGSASEVIVYASDLPTQALSELDFFDDPASPGGKMISLPNNGDELDPPPENDPHFEFKVPVQSGIPYHCWVHLKVGEAKGRSTANVVWVQFSSSVNQTNQEVFREGTKSYLTAQGPTDLGWTWVGCNAPQGGSDSLVYFPSNGEATVRIQAGAEGVGIDQFVLSPAKFLNEPPSEPVVQK
jgi:hypothetical protein